MATTLAAAEAALVAKIAAVITANPGFPPLERNDPAESASVERVILADAQVQTGETLIGSPPLFEIAAGYTLAIEVVEEDRATRDARIRTIRDAITGALEADFQLGGAVDETEISGFDPNWMIAPDGGAASRDDMIGIVLNFIAPTRTGGPLPA